MEFKKRKNKEVDLIFTFLVYSSLSNREQLTSSGIKILIKPEDL
jgi:hypothetical protein